MSKFDNLSEPKSMQFIRANRANLKFNTKERMENLKFAKKQILQGYYLEITHINNNHLPKVKH